MYRIYESKSKIHIEISTNVGIEFFPNITKWAFFEKDVPKKFMLKALNKTHIKDEADVIISSIPNVTRNLKVLFCANTQDLIYYSSIYENKYDICPVNVFKFKPIDFKLPQAHIDRVFFSSQRAFDFFVDKVGLNFLCNKTILAVGKKTAQHIKRYGFNVDYPQIYRSGELDLKNTLVVCPKQHGLYDKQAIVLEVYETLISDDIAFYKYDCDFDFALLTSPQSVEFLKQAGFENYLNRVKKSIICIGTTTQKAVEKFGYSCIIPKEFTIEGMFELMEARIGY